MKRRRILRVPRAPARRYNVERMTLSQMTWQDVQQLPEDGRRHEAIEGETIGEIDLVEVFTAD